MNYDQEYYYERMAETYAGLTGFRRAGEPHAGAAHAHR